MKNEILQYKISRPCYADWAAMTETERGKFCGQCATEVVDFTRMTDAEIMDFFENYDPSQKICARLPNRRIERPKTGWRLSAAALVLGMAVSSCGEWSLNKPIPQTMGMPNPNRTMKWRIEGQIVSNEGKEISGARIILQSKIKNKTSDWFDVSQDSSESGGYFSMYGHQSVNRTDTLNYQLQIAHPDYEPQTIEWKKEGGSDGEDAPLNIVLEPRKKGKR